MAIAANSFIGANIVTIEATDPVASESGSDTGVFVISRTGSTLMPLTVAYIVSGSATSGMDYSGLDWDNYYDFYRGYYNSYRTGHATIPAGESSVTLIVSPYEDGRAEGLETVTVTLTTDYYSRFGYYDNYNYGYYDPDYYDFGYYGYGYYSHGYYNYGQYNYYGYQDYGASDYYGYGRYGYNDYLRSFGGSRYTIGSPSSDTVTILDNQAVVTVTATDPNASELNTDPGVVTFSRTGDTSAALTVYYNVWGTAQPGVDYTGTAEHDQFIYGYYGNYYGLSGSAYYDYRARSVTIPADASSAEVVITPIADSLVEGTETAAVLLAYGNWGSYDYFNTYGYYGHPGYFGYRPTSPGYSIGSSRATVYITDSANTVSIHSSDPNAAEEGFDPAVFTITRSGRTWAPLTVYYRLSGSATPGLDYKSLRNYVDYWSSTYSYGWATIPAGASSIDVTLEPHDDTLIEGTETAEITLIPEYMRGYYGYGYDGIWAPMPTSYSVGEPASVTISIADNDVASGVTITANDPTATEQGPTTGQFTVARTGSTANPLNVYYNLTGSSTPTPAIIRACPIGAGTSGS